MPKAVDTISTILWRLQPKVRYIITQYNILFNTNLEEYYYFLKENGIQDVRRLCEHMSEYLSRYSNINTRYRYMDYNIFNNDHLYFSGKLISIGSIEDIILNRYNMVNNLAGQKIQSALFDTFEQIIGSFEVEKNEPNSKEANFHFVSTNIGSNFFIIQKALSSIEDDNEILKIFKENKESEILKKCKANPSICLLLKNIIVAISEEREYLNSVLMLQDEFNSIILKSKQLKIDDDGVKIIITKDMSEHSIDKLSSGEKQLLTQLTCLLIDSHQRDIFLIDEPEVSFNVLWQEKYIDLLKKCSPKTQFILATHSPSIVSEHTEYLEELKWEN